MYKFFDMLRNERGEAGPKKDEDDKPEEDGLDKSHLEAEEEDDEDGSIEIDLTEDDDVTEDDEDDDSSPSNKAFAEMRVENKELKKTVDEMNEKIQTITQGSQQQAPITTVPDTGSQNPESWTEAQWDKLAKTDWKKAVDLRSGIQARKINETATTNSVFNEVQEKSKQDVLTRHPELNDLDSEKAKIYKNIVTANPDYIHQKKGPMMAMYEMEEYMEKNMGYKREDIVKAEQRAREDESDRSNRVSLTSTVGRNVSSNNKVVLTKDDREFCEIQGIDPKTFAANKRRLEKSGKGGIQL